jgi:predicted transcriptional regulator
MNQDNFTELTTEQLVKWIKSNKDSPLLDEAIAERVNRDKSTVTYSVEKFENKLSEKLNKLNEQ